MLTSESMRPQGSVRIRVLKGFVLGAAEMAVPGAVLSLDRVTAAGIVARGRAVEVPETEPDQLVEPEFELDTLDPEKPRKPRKKEA